MSNNIRDITSNQVNPLLSSLFYKENRQASGENRVKIQDDLLTSSTKGSTQLPLNSDRPLLPPGKSTSSNVLMYLAAQFAKAFEAMNQGIMAETTQYASLQQLDQTMAQCIQQATQNAVNKEDAQFKISEQLAAYQTQSAALLNKWGLGLRIGGYVLMALTFIIGFFTGGATDEAIPEEIEMEEMGSSAADEAEEAGEGGASAAGESGSSSLVDSEDEAISVEAEEEAPVQSATNEVDQSVEETSQQTTQSTESQASIKATLKNIALRALHLGLTGVLSAPTLMTALMNKQVAAKLEIAAQAQQLVGASLASLQETNQYFQYYQQALQREGGVIQDETSGASQVVDTFGDIVNAYRQISYGLANSV